MIDKMPIFSEFSRLYWGEMGPEIYETIESAFTQMLKDAGRLPDGGEAFRTKLYRELMQIVSNSQYADWLEENRTNIAAIKQVAGRFISVGETKALFDLLETKMNKSMS